MSNLSEAVETAVRLIEGEISSTEYRIKVCEIDKIDVSGLKAKIVEWQSQIHELKAGSSTPAPAVPMPIFKDGHPLVTALIWEVDRAVKQAAREGGRYDTIISHILNEHLAAPPAHSAASTVEPQRAPASCPHCIDATDCASVDVCCAVEAVYAAPTTSPEPDAVREALGSFLSVLRGASTMIPNGIELHITKEDYAKARQAYAASAHAALARNDRGSEAQ